MLAAVPGTLGAAGAAGGGSGGKAEAPPPTKVGQGPHASVTVRTTVAGWVATALRMKKLKVAGVPGGRMFEGTVMLVPPASCTTAPVALVNWMANR